MLHIAAQNGHAEVVQLLIDEYELNPSARTKVCGQCTCYYVVIETQRNGSQPHACVHVMYVFYAQLHAHT